MNKPKQPDKQKSEGKKRVSGNTNSKKKKYRVRNWREYNQALVDRGKVIFHITEEAIQQWEENKRTGKRGRPTSYSDIAIETALSIQQVFRLPLRQTEGVLSGMLTKIGANVSSPDYSTLSLRGKRHPVSIRVRPVSVEPIHLVVDSTGAKVFGEGEWKVRQHGISKRRTWRKLHLGVDPQTHDILIGAVTGNDTADCEVLAPLLDQLPASAVIGQCSADGGYDRRICYDALRDRSVAHIAIPPQRNAKIWNHRKRKGLPHPRDANLRHIRTVGRKRWKQESGYHQRSIAETAMFRLKTIFGDRVSARTMEGQQVQLLVRLKVLNRFTMLGMPKSYCIAA